MTMHETQQFSLQDVISSNSFFPGKNLCDQPDRARSFISLNSCCYCHIAQISLYNSGKVLSAGSLMPIIGICCIPGNTQCSKSRYAVPLWFPCAVWEPQGNSVP